ncbi:MAG: hypothetical protein JW764_00125 [Chlorobiaceae bacterium]|nr:hypothetical protein [Chlorobiaceae bacterium]
MGTDLIPARPSKRTAIALGAAVLLLTTTVPYLTLINAMLFAGIISAGSVAAWFYIMRHQVRLSYPEAFVLGGLSGFAGGALSVLAGFLLESWFGYVPGLESLRLLVDWASSMDPRDAENFRQMLAMVSEPKEISLVDLIISMLFTGILYAPLSGLGGRLTVFVLKRKARKK